MGYSINVLNSSTGLEETIKGSDVNVVLHEVADHIVNIKKNANFFISDQKYNYEITGSELKKLILETKKDLAQRTSEELVNQIKEKKEILNSALNQKIDVWTILLEKYEQPFLIPPPIDQDLPTSPKYLTIEEKPNFDSSKYSIKKTIGDSFFKSKYDIKLKEMEQLFNEDLAHWDKKKKEVELKNQQIKDEFENLKLEISTANKINHEKWINEKEAYLNNQNEERLKLLKMKEEFANGKVDSIQYYFLNLLYESTNKNSFYEKQINITHNQETKILALDFLLPNNEEISTVKEIKYVASKDEFEEKHMNKTDFNSYYEDIIYQITLRSIYEIFSHDNFNFVSAIGFNGHVKTIDKSNGQNINPFIVSILVNKSDFLNINFEKIEFKSCFKSLKGISASSLVTLTPIPPIINIDRKDKRFVDSYNVADSIDNTTNIAAMNWEDFEHLIRELFEKEFQSNGGEVKVTQASRDGGVDAVAFDPDPIRGGKIVIQAKRYTNTVGVSAVRDLYGTVVNEGATKGILVSTADYGPDAYEFAKGKPLTLLNGSNLLHLLEKHGHHARIDLREAKKILNNNLKES